MTNQDKTHYWYEIIERWIDYENMDLRYAHLVASIPYDSLEHELFTISNPGIVTLTGSGEVSLAPGSSVYITGGEINIALIAPGDNNIGNVDVGYITGGEINIALIRPGDNNIGNVDIQMISGGETHIGQVGSESTMVIVTPALTGTNTYAAGDCVDGVLEFTDAARVAGMGGVIKQLLIVDDAGQDAQMELWLFNQIFTSPGDSSPWVCPEAQLHNLVGIISTVDGRWYGTGTPSVAVVEVSQQFTCVGTSLFGQLVNRVGTPTYGADDLSIKLGILQD